MPTENAFGAYINQMRRAARMSLRAVTEHMNFGHVYLGEVERGVRPPMQEQHFEALAAAIPGVTVDELRDRAQRSRPLQLSIEDAPANYQNLALALARRIERQDLGDESVDALLRMLGGEDGHVP